MLFFMYNSSEGDLHLNGYLVDSGYQIFDISNKLNESKIVTQLDQTKRIKFKNYFKATERVKKLQMYCNSANRKEECLDNFVFPIKI